MYKTLLPNNVIMKKIFMSAAVVCAALCMNSCGISTPAGTTANTNTVAAGAQTGSTLLNYVLGNLINNTTSFTKADLVGTWNYKGSDCKFESENFLKQAGGEIAASTLEKKMDETFAKIGIKEGSCSFTFNEDGSYAANFGGRTLQGTYTFDEANGKLSMVGLLGLTKSEATLMHTGSTHISLLYDADKLISMATTLSSLTGSSAISSLTSLLGSYDGVKIGFELSK